MTATTTTMTRAIVGMATTDLAGERQAGLLLIVELITTMVVVMIMATTTITVVIGIVPTNTGARTGLVNMILIIMPTVVIMVLTLTSTTTTAVMVSTATVVVMVLTLASTMTTTVAVMSMRTVVVMDLTPIRTATTIVVISMATVVWMVLTPASMTTTIVVVVSMARANIGTRTRLLMLVFLIAVTPVILTISAMTMKVVVDFMTTNIQPDTGLMAVLVMVSGVIGTTAGRLIGTMVITLLVVRRTQYHDALGCHGLLRLGCPC